MGDKHLMRSLIWLLLLIILSPIKSQPITYYFPLITKTTNAGIAWYEQANNRHELVGAYYYYNEASCLHLDNPQAIPIVRPINAVDCNLPIDYDDYVLVGNEGEGQDNLTPEQMSEFILWFADNYPSAKLICLNSYDIDYMLDVIALLPEDTCYGYGIHIGIWSDLDNGLSAYLDQLCTNCIIWITELSWPNSSPIAYNAMYQLVYEGIADYRVHRIFGYTTTDGIPSSLNFLNEERELNPNGQAFYDALQAYP